MIQTLTLLVDARTVMKITLQMIELSNNTVTAIACTEHQFACRSGEEHRQWIINFSAVMHLGSFQPSIAFPGRKFGTVWFDRSFQWGLFEKWQKLHRVKETDGNLLFICTTTVTVCLLKGDWATGKRQKKNLVSLSCQACTPIHYMCSLWFK